MRERVPSPQFSGNRPPSTDFEAVRDGHRAILLQYGPIDLSVARSIAAGTALPVKIAGNIFYADPYIDIATGVSLAGTARVHFQDIANQQSPFLTAQPTSLFKIPFTQLLIENAAQPGKFLLIGYGTDLDLQPGISSQVQASIISSVALALDDASVQAIRSNDADIAAGQGFFGSKSVALVAGTFNEIELWNPPGSGIIVYVDRWNYLDNTGADNMLVESATVLVAGGDPLVHGANRNFGGLASLAVMKAANVAASTGVLIAKHRAQANVEIDYVERNAIRLVEGQGLILSSATLAHATVANFEWRERAV